MSLFDKVTGSTSAMVVLAVAIFIFYLDAQSGRWVLDLILFGAMCVILLFWAGAYYFGKTQLHFATFLPKHLTTALMLALGTPMVGGVFIVCMAAFIGHPPWTFSVLGTLLGLDIAFFGIFAAISGSLSTRPKSP